MFFQLNEAELLESRISHAHFTELLNQRGTTILEVSESSNIYGEWLFVTLTARIPTFIWLSTTTPTPKPQPRSVTFWGLGYHESRERWLTDEWRWFETTPLGMPANSMPIPKPQAWKTIHARLAMCKTEAAAIPPTSNRAQAFAFFADLTDEEGATTELEDLEAIGLAVEGLFDE
jgi:hypothetical protein